MKIYSKGFWSLTNILISIPLDELATNLYFLSSCRSQKHCFKQLKWFTSTKEVKRQIIKLRLENSVKIKTWKNLRRLSPTWWRCKPTGSNPWPQHSLERELQRFLVSGPVCIQTTGPEEVVINQFLNAFMYRFNSIFCRTDTSQALHPYRGKERQDSSGRSQIRPPSHGGEGSLQPGTSSSAWTSWVSLAAGSPAQYSSVFPSTPAT